MGLKVNGLGPAKEKRFCEVKGVRYESQEGYHTGDICDGCAGHGKPELCLKLDSCGYVPQGTNIIWVEVKS